MILGVMICVRGLTRIHGTVLDNALRELLELYDNDVSKVVTSAAFVLFSSAQDESLP